MGLIDGKVEPPAPGKTSLRFGPAFLRPAEEKDHYELMRNIVSVTNEGDKTTTESHPQPIGPLAVYRVKRKGDKIAPTSHFNGPPPEMRTSDPKTGQPMTLVLVWWPGQDPQTDE